MRSTLSIKLARTDDKMSDREMYKQAKEQADAHSVELTQVIFRNDRQLYCTLFFDKEESVSSFFSSIAKNTNLNPIIVDTYTHSE